MKNLELAKQWSPNNTKPHTDFTDMSGKKALWVCDKDHEWEAVIAKRSRGQGCPYCSNKKILPGYNDLSTTHPNVASEWSLKNDINPTEVSYGSKKSVLWDCPTGHEYSSRIAHRASGHGCPYCANQKVIPGENDIKTTNPELLVTWSKDNFITPTEVTRSSSKKINRVCQDNHTWESYVYTLSNGFGCPVCAKVSPVSTYESEVISYLEGIYTGNIVKNTRKIIPPKELDIFLPELNIGIEFNGIYWHSDRYLDKNSHKEKMDKCKKVGVRLISVWEDDWVFRNNIVKSMIKHKIGLSFDRIFARKTKTVVISHETSSKFLNEYHIQGRAYGSYYLGLVSKDSNDLVAVMVLKRSGDTLTLERYATSVHVVGGQSKLLKYVDQHIPYTQMVTFADLTVSDGNLYEKTGWTMDKILPPDYRYVYKGRREHKFNFRKDRFRRDPNLKFEEGLTERELAELNNIPRIHDCGKIRYIRVNPSVV